LFAPLKSPTSVHDNMFRHRPTESTEYNALGRYTFHITYFLLLKVLENKKNVKREENKNVKTFYIYVIIKRISDSEIKLKRHPSKLKFT